ncbi:tricarballylate utilization 4Fe-4S protein TcuB [Paraburkholderia caffeinilytica]|uniref:tricarballylate utilization 4Fe-4S protein TcuB n=1 Tax=Paraburkholderia caffeinilytica TaxID=1761016 RepID=UPI0038BBDB0B
MQSLETLIQEASALATHEAEVSRVLQICNACRYCEGFCAVFPAMTHRLEFGQADIHFLANLCHNCGACLYSCQYAPPHEFAVNVPQAMARVRLDTYTRYAWPNALGALYQRNGLTLALATAICIAILLSLARLLNGPIWSAPPGGHFYAVFPHGTLAGMFGIAFVYATIALTVGVSRFWRNGAPGPASAAALKEAAHDAMSMRYLGGGHGEGCNNADDAFTLWRRRFHHLTFYGFMLCFAATCVATIYHYALHAEAPYSVTSLPVLLGTVGGVGLAAGCIGLGVLHMRRNPAQGDSAQRPMDLGFIALLLLTSLTGLALLGWRSSQGMPLLLAFHLGVVMALFLTMPYSKFAHGVYRGAALLKWSIERRQPNPLRLSDD